MVTLATKIRTWYAREYPSDDLAKEISPTITFRDLFDALDAYQDVYELLGVGDSVIRERVFTKLAEIIGMDYDYIYDQWLMGAHMRGVSACSTSTKSSQIA